MFQYYGHIHSEGRDVFPCDFRAKTDFFALNDCLCAIIMKNMAYTCLIVLDPEIPFTLPEIKGISGTDSAYY